MIDFWTAKIEGHRRNIQRYIRLLPTELTEFERQYLHNQIAEEQDPGELKEPDSLGPRSHPPSC